MHADHLLRTWSCIVGVAILAIAGEVLIAAAMRRLGDLDIIREHSGLPGSDSRRSVESSLSCRSALHGAQLLRAAVHT